MKLKSLLSLLFCFLICFVHAYIGSSAEVGTLIVSYHTGLKGERLDRVRFLLSSESGEEGIYPKAHIYMEDEEDPSRMVAIEDLPVGKYSLKFLIPNQDGLFEEIPERQIVIGRNSVVKIDQSIHPRYATLKATATTTPENSYFDTLPTISLKDSSGHLHIQTTSGNLVTHSLPPGRYTLTFEPLIGYHTPESMSIDLAADQVSGPIIGNYIKESAIPQIRNNLAASTLLPGSGRGTPYTIINQVNSQLIVNTNMERAQWTLYRNNEVIYVGTGSKGIIQVPEGNNYSIEAEALEGYSARVSPPGDFNLYYAQTTRAEIFYERMTGSLSIQAPFPEGESLLINLTPLDGNPPIAVTIKAREGKINWKSVLLPSGTYEISYTLPPPFEPITPERIIILPKEVTKLHPHLIKGATLHVSANVPEAIFLLRTAKDAKAWKGEGREFSFKGLPGSNYILSFSTKDPEFFNPPEEVRITLRESDVKEINAVFQLKSKLIINTNIDHTNIIIQELGGKRRSIPEEIAGHSRIFSLPEGKYRIVASSSGENDFDKLRFIPPEPIEVTLKPLGTEELTLAFKAGNTIPLEKQRKLTVVSNTASAGFTIKKFHGFKEDVVGHYSGKVNLLNLPDADHYEIVFDTLPNHQTPEKALLVMQPGESKTIEAAYSPTQQTADIPAGRAIIGEMSPDEMINEQQGRIVQISLFAIGIYEVTNEQFAGWLTNAQKAHKVAYVNEGGKQGQVLDLDGRLVCKTLSADPNSQIAVQSDSLNGTIFTPVAGKDLHPVIDVSWYGAVAYCQDNHCRLPTEAEWEKAAGCIEEQPGTPLKKLRYGFENNEIDRTWANYKSNDQPIRHFQVATTSVGFYNGVNFLPLTETHSVQQQVHLAKSPYGAYDMSGNVWEWVADWYSLDYYKTLSDVDPKGPSMGTKKVAKGGCYDSLADGVRITERLALHPEHADVFTGFRIAIDIHNGIQELEIGASMGLYVDTPSIDKPTFIKK